MKLLRDPDEPRLAPAQPSASPPVTAVGTHGDPDRMVRLREVAALLAVSKATVWRLVTAKKLEAPTRVSTNAVAWRRTTVLDYLSKCEAEEKTTRSVVGRERITKDK